MDMDIYQPLAIFFAGVVTSGVAMLMRGDFIGRRAAEEVEKRLNERIEREMAVISRDLIEIKEMVKEQRQSRTSAVI